jgi:hypothetical protein
MANSGLPEGIPPVYRGGSSLIFNPHEVRIDKRTGLLRTISVDSEAQRVARFGGAFLVRALPDGLTIIQRGRRPQHLEIVPAIPVTPAQYQELLDQIELELFLKEPVT